MLTIRRPLPPPRPNTPAAASRRWYDMNACGHVKWWRCVQSAALASRTWPWGCVTQEREEVLERG